MTDQAKSFDVWKEVKVSSLTEAKRAPENNNIYSHFKVFEITSIIPVSSVSNVSEVLNLVFPLKISWIVSEHIHVWEMYQLH